MFTIMYVLCLQGRHGSGWTSDTTLAALVKWGHIFGGSLWEKLEPDTKTHAIWYTQGYTGDQVLQKCHAPTVSSTLGLFYIVF